MTGDDPDSLPLEWLEERRISQDWLAEAYDSIPANFRGCLKTALAAAYAHFSPQTGIASSSLKLPHANLCRRNTSAPVAITLIIFPASYLAAARLCGAAILPVISDVGTTMAASIGGRPQASALLALELSGVEDIYCLEERDLPDLLAGLEPFSSRMLLLEPKVRSHALNSGIPFYEELREPNLLLLDPDCFDPESLKFAQGYLPSAAGVPGQIPDCVYAAPGKHGDIFASFPETSLFLSPGLEGLWLFPGLDRNFFRSEQTAFSCQT